MLRMWDRTSPAGVVKYYDAALAKAGFNYYGEGQEGPLVWWGKGAERQGLEGEVKRKDFVALTNNKNPQTGEPLTARTKDKRRVLMEIVVDYGKGPAIMRELYGDQAMESAAERVRQGLLEEIEKNTETRVRKAGKDEDRHTGEIIAAIAPHRTSRPVDGVSDMHWHDHLLIWNATYDKVEDRFKAIQLGNLKRDSPYYQAFVNALWAHELQQMGYVPKSTKYGVDLEGIPKSVIDKFSRRRNEIEKEAQNLNIQSGEGKHRIGANNREKKSKDLSMEQLRDLWNERISPEERTALDKVHRKQIERKGPTITAERAMDFAIEHEFVKRSTISEKRLKATALEYGLGHVLPGDMDQAFLSRRDLINVRKDGQDMVTTRDMLNAEISVLKFARDGRGEYAAFTKDFEAIKDLQGEQRDAALHILKSRDQIVGVRGGAGTGKTTVMTPVVQAIRDAGYEVHAFAPSSQASRNVLVAAGFKDANTLDSMLINPQAQQKLRNQVIWVDEAGMIGTQKMNRLTMVAKQQNARIITTGDYFQHGSVEAGSPFRDLEKQGGVRYAELKENRRQKNLTHRAAVTELNKGTKKGVEKGWAMLEKMGAVVEIKNDPDASVNPLHKAAVDYYLKAQEDGKSCLLIIPTHTEGAQVTALLREELRERKALNKRETIFASRISTDWTIPQKQDSRLYEPGQIVEFIQNVPGERVRIKGKKATIGGFTKGESAAVIGSDDNGRVILLRQNGSETFLPQERAKDFQVYRKADLGVSIKERLRLTINTSLRNIDGVDRKVNNGDIVTVKGFRENGDLETTNGLIIPKTFGHFRYGYVDTSPSSQGKTVDRSAVVFGNTSVLAVNSQLGLVSASRPKEELRVFVSDMEETRKAVMKSGQRQSALELVKGTKYEPQRNWFKETMERSRVLRYLRRRRDAFVERWRPSRPVEGRSYA